jgi:serine kinase of HPr protein (carbohydrate metabolism regulator)
MSKHTPGPWIANGYAIEQAETVDRLHTYVIAFLHRDDDRDDVEQEGDARLIAAAPEMLDALKEIREACCSGMGSLPAADIARAEKAIAKAEGAARLALTNAEGA